MDMSKEYTNVSLITVLLVAGTIWLHKATLLLKSYIRTFEHEPQSIHEAFFLSQNFSPDWLYLHVCVTAGSEHPIGVVKVTSHTARSFSGAVLL